MTGVPSSLAVTVDTSRAGRVRDAELVGVEEKGIGVGNVKLLLFTHQTGALAGDVLDQSLSEGGRQMTEFFLCEVSPEVTVPLLSFHNVVVVVLYEAGKKKTNG